MKTVKGREKTAILVRDYIFIFLGAATAALGWASFLMPAQIVGGGIGGLAALVYYASGFSAGLFYLAVNVVLLLLAVRILGASFGMRTIVGMLATSAGLALFPYFISGPLVNDTFLATILGSALTGLGIGMALAHQGSTGGTEIIAMIINHYRNVSPGRIMLFIDVFIIGSSFLLFRSIEKVVYGYVSMAVAMYVVDIYLDGSRQSVQLLIISKAADAIAVAVDKDVARGITVFRAIGWHSKQAVDPLMILARRGELTHIMEIIKENDEHAFVSVAKVMGVFGNGFDRIKL
ncbi:MAG: YitT family protein [Spirochaetes bacterium]|nr:YitT family protein [Spirochaetota bacterium]MBU0956913.1 YitT family protein [Spirochaetota bacterium]